MSKNIYMTSDYFQFTDKLGREFIVDASRKGVRVSVSEDRDSCVFLSDAEATVLKNFLEKAGY